jgi:hypothetical protein
VGVVVEEEDGCDIEVNDGVGVADDDVTGLLFFVDDAPMVMVNVPVEELWGEVRDAGIGMEDVAMGKGESNDPVMPTRLKNEEKAE